MLKFGKNSLITEPLRDLGLQSVQTELERDRDWDRELNQDKWVLRYYVILSHCNLCGNLKVTRNLGNGFPTHSAPYLVTLQGNLQCVVQYSQCDTGQL